MRIFEFLFFGTAIMLVFSCNNKSNNQETIIDELINEKNKEITKNYSYDSLVCIKVRSRSLMLNNYFDNILDGNSKFCDSIINYCKEYNDEYTEKKIMIYKSNIENYKNEIKILQYRMLCDIENRYNERLFYVDGVDARAYNDSRIKIGDTLKSRISLCATSIFNSYYSVFNNDTLRGYDQIYMERFNKPGKYIREGKVVYRMRNKTLSLPVNIDVIVEK